MLRNGLLVLSLLLSITACGTCKPVIKTQVVEKHVPVPVAIDAKFTTQVPAPTIPEPKCRDAKGIPTLCNEQTADWLTQLLNTIQTLNSRLQKIEGLQPKR